MITKSHEKHTTETPEVKLRKLSREIVKSHGHLRVKSGRTNGEPVLHVRNPGVDSYTIRNVGEWAECPLNIERKHRDRATSGSQNSAKREAEINETETLIANKDAI